MPILFAGNHISDMDQVTACVDQVLSGTFDPIYVKSSITSSTETSFFTVGHPLSNQPIVWFHFMARRGGSNGYYSAETWFEIRDDNGKVIFRITRTSATSDAYNSYLIGSSTLTNPSQFSMSATTQFDICIETNATHLIATIYLNKVFHSTFTVAKGISVTPKSMTILPRKVKYASVLFGFSEFIISTDMTVDQRVAHLEVASQGFHADMVGNVLNLNDADSGSGLLSELAGQRHSWVPSAYAGPADDVAAIVGKVIANRVGGTPSQLNQFLRLGGADYDGAAEVVGTQTYHQQIWSRNPANNQPWTTADLANIQVGLKTGT